MPGGPAGVQGANFAIRADWGRQMYLESLSLLELSSTVKQAQYMNPVCPDFIKQSIPPDEQLTDTRLLKLGHDATTLGKCHETLGCGENFFEKGKSCSQRIFGDVGNDFVEIGPCSCGPNYFALLCHLALSSRFTSSWLSCFPCMMSRLPRSMV